MLNWLRDKSGTTTPYNPVPNDQFSNNFNSQSQTTPSTSQKSRHSNGRQVFF